MVWLISVLLLYGPTNLLFQKYVLTQGMEVCLEYDGHGLEGLPLEDSVLTCHANIA